MADGYYRRNRVQLFRGFYMMQEDLLFKMLIWLALLHCNSTIPG